MKLTCLFSLCACVGVLSLSAQKAPEPSDAKALGRQLMSNLPGIFSIDESRTVAMGGFEIPAIRNGDWMLTTQPVPLVESFTKDTQAIAAFFVKAGDEFIRLSTTEPGEKAGTALSHSHPAYNRLHGELRYTGVVTLSGQRFMADYDVFRDRQGRIVGAYVVGIPMAQ
jgi:methyl-accepting chemotaxis protein